MNTRTSIMLLCGAVAIGAMVHCGGSSPTQPPSGGGGPTTTTTTTTTQPPGIVLPVGMVCSPTPPPLYGISVKAWGKSLPGRWIMDTKPQVMNLDGYCGRLGMGDTVKFCDTRIEGDSERVACDYLAVGQASDTGRWGPTWSFNGQPCAPIGGSGDCINHDTNQFQAIAKASGRFEACASALAKVDPSEGSRCGVRDVDMP